LKKQFLYFIIFSIGLCLYGQDTIVYKGFVIVNSSGATYPYELQFAQNDKEIEGFSITNQGFQDETKNRIKGLYYGNKKSLNIQEMSIIETNSIEELDAFCYLQLDLIKNNKKLNGTFIGYFNDSIVCAQGEVFLMEDKILKKKLKKLNKKLSKIDTVELKKIIENPDIFKKKINMNPIDSLNMIHKDTCSISVTSPFVFSIWDDKKEDGDLVKILVNNEVILDDFMLKNEKHNINFDDNTEKTSIQIIAKNVGDTPPNTVTIEIHSNNQVIPLKGKLKKNEYIQIEIN
tara:strand:- start:44 stop:910 length:867 start_codon:yes stop_codon:yes gene_type:complete